MIVKVDPERACEPGDRRIGAVALGQKSREILAWQHAGPNRDPDRARRGARQRNELVEQALHQLQGAGLVGARCGDRELMC